MRGAWPVVALFSTLLPLAALAQMEPQFSARFFSDVMHSTDDQPADIDLLNELWFEAKIAAGQGSHGLVSLNSKFIRSSTAPDATVTEIGLREAYWRIRKSSWSLKYGQYIHRWGKADILSPLDLWVARDQRFIVIDENRQFLAAPMAATLVWTPASTNRVCIRRKVYRRKGRKRVVCKKFENQKKMWPVSLELMATAATPYNRVTEVPFSAGPYSVTYETSKTTSELGAGEYGARLSYSGSSTSLGLSFYRGATHSPYFTYESLVGSTVTLGYSYPELAVYGLEFEQAFSRWVLRWEVAYKDGLESEFDAGRINNSIETTLVMDFRLGSEWRLVFYPSYKKTTIFEEPEDVTPTLSVEQALLYGINSVVHEFNSDSKAKIGIRLGYEDSDGENRMNLVGLYNVTDGDHMVQFDLGHSFTDFIEMSLGVNAFSGPSGTQLRYLQEQGRAFIKTTLWF